MNNVFEQPKGSMAQVNQIHCSPHCIQSLRNLVGVCSKVQVPSKRDWTQIRVVVLVKKGEKCSRIEEKAADVVAESLYHVSEVFSWLSVFFQPGFEVLVDAPHSQFE